MLKGTAGVILKKSFAMPEILIPYKGINYPCLIDPEDLELVSRFSWSLNPKGYAVAWDPNRKRNILMHRLVMGVLDQPDIEIDHRFHNRLDQRKTQLRACNHSQNRQNSRKLKPGTSQYKGVYFETERGQFHAQIGLGDRVKNLGRFRSEILAAKIYDQRAIQEFKDYAYPNFQSSREAQQLTFSWV
jgi:hypothetical protein